MWSVRKEKGEPFSIFFYPQGCPISMTHHLQQQQQKGREQLPPKIPRLQTDPQNQKLQRVVQSDDAQLRLRATAEALSPFRRHA